MSLDKYSGQLAAGPDIVSRGFVYVRESDELMEEARHVVDNALSGCIDRGITDWGKLKSTTKDVLFPDCLTTAAPGIWLGTFFSYGSIQYAQNFRPIFVHHFKHIRLTFYSSVSII